MVRDWSLEVLGLLAAVISWGGAPAVSSEGDAAPAPPRVTSQAPARRAPDPTPGWREGDPTPAPEPPRPAPGDGDPYPRGWTPPKAPPYSSEQSQAQAQAPPLPAVKSYPSAVGPSYYTTYEDVVVTPRKVRHAGPLKRCLGRVGERLAECGYDTVRVPRAPAPPPAPVVESQVIMRYRRSAPAPARAYASPQQ